MKKILLALLLSSSLSYSISVKLPDAKTLESRFNQKGFEHFIDATRIVKKLAEIELEPFGIIVIVKAALTDYSQYVKNDMVAAMVKARLYEIYELILEDHPQALEELEELIAEL